MHNPFGWSLTVATGAAAWVCMLAARAGWNFWSIQKLRLPAGARDPDCMVVIPARNEEAVIARAVRSLPHDSVIVVDDHSEDETAEAARKAGAGVLRAPDLARGVFGKSNGCLAGARALESRWILFADADTWFEEGFLAALAGAAELNDLAFVSVHLDPKAETPFDRMLLPVARTIQYAAIRPRGDPVTAFRGECILVRRNGYEFLGGHATVLNSLTEDTKLAALALRHRLKFGVVRSGGLGHATFREGFATARRTGYKLVLLDFATVLIALSGSFAMAAWPVAAVWAGMAGNWGVTAALIAIPVAAAAVVWGSGAALLLPVSAYVYAFGLWSGFLRGLRGRRISWKGRAV